MTTTLTEQPTASLIVERCTTLTIPETVIPATNPRTQYPDKGGVDLPVYITGIHTMNPGDGNTEHVGTVRLLNLAPSGNGWLDTHNVNAAGRYPRYEGALVNPEPVNGRYYRSLSSTSFLVRYNDDAHRADRHNEAMPWSLIRGEGERAWPVPNDGLFGDGNTIGGDYPYVEVEFTETPETAVRTAETTEPEAEAEPPATWEDGERTATRGWAMTEEDGTVLLNPELVEGQTYLFWMPEGFDPQYSDAHVMTYLGGDILNENSFTTMGSLDWRHSTETVRFSASYYGGLTTRNTNWVKARVTRPEAADDTTQVTAMEALIDSELAEFQEFNEKTNDIAEQAGWCSEYDRIVKGVGMFGRQKAWDVRVTAEFTFEDNHPSSEFDENAREQFDAPSLTINDVRYTAKMTVTVRVDEATNSDDAEERVGSSSIEEAIHAQTSGMRDIDVNDWTILDSEEVDN